MGKRTNLQFPIEREFSPLQIETLNACKTYRYILYSGAFGAGKTLLLANAAIRTCLSNPGCVGFLGSQTWTHVDRVIFTTFKQELNMYQKALNDNNIPINLISKIVSTVGRMETTFYNKAKIYFGACDEERKIAGINLDFAGLDEPVDLPEEFFHQTVGRLREKNLLKEHNFVLLTTNPGDQFHWIYKKFIQNPTQEHYTVETTTYDNPFLTKKYIGSLEEYDEDWRRRYLSGKWGAFEGQVYKSFNPDKHVGNYKYMDLSKFNYIVGGVDFGLRDPCVLVVIGVMKDNTCVILDEIYKPTTSRDFSKMLANKHEKYNFRKLWCDPTALDLIIQTHDLGVPIEKANREISPGISRVSSLFFKDKLLVDHNCKNTIKEHLAYRYGKSKSGRNPTEKPIDKDNHTCDAVRYAVMGIHVFRDESSAEGTKGRLNFKEIFRKQKDNERREEAQRKAEEPNSKRIPEGWWSNKDFW